MNARVVRSIVLGVMAALLPRAAAAQEVFQDNVVIVLDASGSMTGIMQGVPTTRMQAAKQALMRVVDKLPESTNVGLLVFSSANLSNDWAYPLGPVNRPALRAAVQFPEPSGHTPLGAYLKKGADALLEQRKKQRGYGTYRLLMVTDGEANDPELVAAYLPDVLARGITLDVIGVDMAADHSMATRAHSYRGANDPEALARAVNEVFAEVGGDRQGNADEESFALLEGLSPEVGAAMLEALTTTGNAPIGENPPGAASPASGFPAAGGGQGGPLTVDEVRGPKVLLVVLLFLFVAAGLGISIGLKVLRRRL